MDSILLYTDDNIIGQAIHDYMIDRARRITTLSFQDIVKGICAPPTATVIINIIHKDISAATTVALLNTLRKRLTHCALLVLIVKSELSSLFRELIDMDNLMILTEKSSLSDYSATTANESQRSLILTTKRYTATGYIL